VKKDFDRFPRARTKAGKTVELLTPLSDANRDADAHAFAALMRHVREVDSAERTVIMIQVENEVGMAGDSRDHSPAADKAYAGSVPKELMDYLEQHKATLIPEFRKVWETAGSKTSGTWEEVFGPGAGTEGIFMAWHFAHYLDRVAAAGKAEYPIPMFVNAALYGVGREEFPPSGGRPWDLVMDVWKAAAPRIDMLSPDAYGNFTEFCGKYNRPGNPLFIPESLNGAVGAARVLYAFGHDDAVGFSAMGAVERSNDPDTDLIGSYDLIAQLAPLISKHQGDGTMSAVLLGPNDPPAKVKVGNYTLEVKFVKPRVAPLTQPTPIPPNVFAAGIFIAAGPDEYFVAGLGIDVTFAPNTPGPPIAGLATVEEGSFVEGRWVPGRMLAGDSTDEGQTIRISWPPGSWVPVYRQRSSPDAIQRVTLYRYR
jgi:hypothetical protein